MKLTVSTCIKAFRKMEADNVPITSLALLEAFKIQPTDRSDAMSIAAGWISTMRRYGFVRIVRGAKVDGPRRKIQVYELTDWGRRYKTKGKSTLRIAANPSGNQG